jgi:hypothetical protein
MAQGPGSGESDARDEPSGAALRRPEGVLRGAGAPSFTARLEQWVADARVDEAARARSRERWLREVAEQEATLTGVLADLAERRSPVTLEVGGRRLHGTVAAIGADFVAVHLATGADVLLALRALGVVRTAPAVGDAVGDRMVATELRLADVLGELAADHDRVRLVTISGETVSGRLRSVGLDVVAVRTDGERHGAAYVPIAAITEVTVG